MQVRVVGRAKLNFVLRVLGKRPDGFHEIWSLMQTVALADDVTVRPAPRTDVHFELAAGLSGIPPEAPDLVARAVELFALRAGMAERAEVHVLKRIPMAAGLAGGSADAAAALLGMNTIAGGPMPPERLEALGAELGSDVPFSLRGGMAVATGRGERLASLHAGRRLWWVLGVSEFQLKTRDVYAHVRPGTSSQVAEPGALLETVRTGSAEAVARCLGNDLEAAAFEMAPLLGARKGAVLEAGALGVVVSGSGPTIAGLCRDEEHARRVSARLAGTFQQVEVVASADVGAEVQYR
ncbi:MAG: 4-(cytidine 5'-diphospho)-2-C-methyl-D-erythritol kinase [Actinomycetota bacterium]